MCKKTIAVVKSLDLLSRVEYLDAVNRWPEIQERFPNLDRARCLEDMHAVSAAGKVHVGFDAYRGLAWVLPLGWLLLPVFYFPGVPWIGAHVYRVVADHRLSGSCALPTPVGSSARLQTGSLRANLDPSKISFAFCHSYVLSHARVIRAKCSCLENVNCD